MKTYENIKKAKSRPLQQMIWGLCERTNCLSEHKSETNYDSASLKEKKKNHINVTSQLLSDLSQSVCQSAVWRS